MNNITNLAQYLISILGLTLMMSSCSLGTLYYNTSYFENTKMLEKYSSLLNKPPSRRFRFL